MEEQENNMAKIKMGATKFSVGGMTRQPRSFADVLSGSSTVKYNRAKPAKLAPAKTAPVNTKGGKAIYGGKGWGG